MRALVTGGYGFVGRHLAQHLVQSGDDVAVTYLSSERKGRSETERETGRFEAPLPPSVQSLALDITDGSAVEQLLAVLRPDAVYHLAAIAFVPDGEQRSKEVFDVNFHGTLNLVEGILKCSPATRLLSVSSAEVYGDPRPGTLPLSELATLRPITVYGLSKAAADLAVFKATFSNSLDSVRVRPFPHIGPGQSDRFAVSSFARQLAEIKLGKRPPVIQVGNLEAKRDYSDVSDIVRGYRDVFLNGKKGEVYNLCSGTAVSIGEILQQLLQIAEVEAEIVVDAERMRPVDIPELVGSAAKAQKECGWRPRVTLEGALHSIFAFWLERLSKSAE